MHDFPCQQITIVMTLEQQPAPRRPIGLSIVGWAFIAIGLLAAWDIIEDALNSRVNLNLTVLMIPVGIGLLRGRSSSRYWALIWIGLTALSSGLMFVFYPFNGDNWSITWSASELQGWPRHVTAISLSLGSLFVAIMAWRAVSSKAAEEFIDSRTLVPPMSHDSTQS
jgi:hypothetical protein